MRATIDPSRFAEERVALALRFCCEDCAYFLAATQRCAHGWPSEDHRLSRYEEPGLRYVVYCKEFELR